jgi:hypothetical protein
VAGVCGHRELYGIRQQMPLRIEPHGIVEPFGWLISKIE